MRTRLGRLMIIAIALVMIVPMTAATDGGVAPAEAAELTEITILHTNDFHGRLETDYRDRGGSAYMAKVVNDIRADVGEDNVALLDGGDVYFAAPAISQLLMGESTIDIYNMMGYDVAAFGNHEFDKGQAELAARVAQSDFPWLGANVVLEGTDWDLPAWADAYTVLDVGGIKLGVLGLAGEETPEVTLLGTTAGLEFKDLTETIVHYYDEVLAAADAMVVLVHMGTQDSGPYDGLMTVAQNLIDLGKPVDLMIGGHQHEAIDDPIYVGDTAIVAAGYYGRWLGRLDVAIDPDAKSLTVLNRDLITISGTDPYDQDIADRIAYWAEVVAPIVNEPVGATNIDLTRDYNDESLIGDIVTDSMLWNADLLDDGELNGTVDAAFTNPGGLREDILIPEGADLPHTITWGDTFDVLPFGNTLYMMDLTGAQIQALVDQSATLYKGILQTSGVTHYWYNDTGNEFATAWGGYGVEIGGEPLARDEVYRIVTNDFVAGGQDGYTTFAEGTNRWNTYFDMQEGFVEYVKMLGVIDAEDIPGDRVTRLDNVVTMLHANDTHGRWAADYYGGGMVYLSSLIAAERAHNPDALLFDAGDTFQGNSFAYFFKDRPDNPIAGGMNMLEYDAMVVGNHEFNFGPATFETMLSQVEFPLLGSANLDDDGSYGFAYKLETLIGELETLLADGVIPSRGVSNSLMSKLESARASFERGMLATAHNKLDAFMNEVSAQAGKKVPAAAAELLLEAAEWTMTSFVNENLEDYITLDVNGKKVIIFGLTNPRVYRYELPTNIPGLTFYSAVDTAAEMLPGILAVEEPDLMVGLTHVGYQPYGGEVDSDELIAQSMEGFDVLIGGHSHTLLDPAVMVSDPGNNPDGTLIAHARRYAGYLGQVNVGFIGDEMVLREGFLIPTSEAVVEPELDAYLAPYVAEIDAYNNTVIGATEVPIDALEAYTEETNGANLQADAAVFELGSNGVDVDIHLSGAMSNRLVAAGATPADPVEITKGDMFTLMPYENSLVVLEMNGPEIKEILERSYDNWWWFSQGWPWGGRSHYTTCMLATDAGNVITYTGDLSTEPDGNNVASLTLNGTAVDFADAGTYYNVSTVNYVAAGSCNFNNDGETIWPLEQIVADTQLYVRDSVINYVEAQTDPISPAIEGRLVFPAP